MKVHYEKEVAKLREMLHNEAQHVIEHVKIALDPFASQEAKLHINDDIIDKAEIHIEEECLKIIALHQPVADELRFIVSVVKLNHELERIADIASKLGMFTIDINQMEQDFPEICPLFIHLTQQASSSIERAYQSFQEANYDLAIDVWREDQNLDKNSDKLIELIYKRMSSSTTTLLLFQTLDFVRRTERMADHATNIAKDVIYMVTGEIVRHRRKELLALE